MVAVEYHRYAMRFYLPVCRQHVNQGISAQHDILLVQSAEGCRLADKIISVYDDMNGHFNRQSIGVVIRSISKSDLTINSYDVSLLK